MMHYRGTEKASGGLAGGWGVYVEGFETNPLAPAKELSMNEEEQLDPATKRRKLVAARFGKEDESAAIESVLFHVEEKFPERPGGEEDEDVEDEGGVFRPRVDLRFEGSHVFKGIRTLAEEGVVMLDKMPGWMTGEEGVTSGTVRDGKVERKNNALSRFSRA
jgi:central kinetochore subunit Mis15/CHL4